MPGASFGKLRYLCVYSLVKNQFLTSNLYHCRSDITTTSESGEISYGVAGNIHDINKHLHVFPPFFTNGNSYFDFLFASMDGNIVSKLEFILAEKEERRQIVNTELVP